MSLYSTSVQRLNEIYQLLYNDKNTTYQDFLDGNHHNKRQARQEMNNWIKERLKQVGYNGKNNAENIYWFAKGLNLPAPSPPKRYDQSDDYVLRKIKRNVNKQKNVAKDDFNINKKINYKKFNKSSSEIDQERIVNNIKEDLEKTPTEWYINFDVLNDYGKKLLFPILEDALDNKIAKLAMKNQYKFRFSVDGEWHTKPLTPELFSKLRENFKLQNFIFNMRSKPSSYHYDAGKDGKLNLPEWSLYSSISFLQVRPKEGYQTVEGGFFKYLINPNIPTKIIKYLKRLQIFDSLTKLNGKQKKELNDCCFVYALSMTGLYSEEELNQIRLRVQNRYLTQGSINKLCEEFKIHLSLTYIDDETESKNKKHSIRPMINGSRKNYLGVEKTTTNRTHKFNIYEKHYFIEEKTPFTYYYIKNFENIKDESKFNLEFRKDGEKSRWIKGRSFISSSNLVRELFKKGYFKPITYGEYSILNTIFYNEIENDISNINLEFNEDYCCQLI